MPRIRQGGTKDRDASCPTYQRWRSCQPILETAVQFTPRHRLCRPPLARSMFPRALVPTIHHPRRPRASPLWQLVHHAWDNFLATYENRHRRSLGPLRPDAIATVRAFLRCRDLAADLTLFHLHHLIVDLSLYFLFYGPPRLKESRKNRSRKNPWQSGADSQAPKQPDERINLHATENQPEISFPAPRGQPHSSFFTHPSSFPSPLSPRTPSLPESTLWPSPVRRARKQIPSRHERSPNHSHSQA